MENKKLEISKEDAIKYYGESPRAMQIMFETAYGKDTFNSPNIESIKLPYPSNTTDKWERQLNAQMQLFHIAKYYNGDWVADFKNGSQYKYILKKYWSGSRWVVIGCYGQVGAGYPSGVCFKSSEIVDLVIEKYPDIVNDYFMID